MNNILRNIARYFSEFGVLKTASKDFWLVNAVNFFQCLAYFSLSFIITLYLTKNAGLSDVDSGKWYSYYALYIVAVIFMVGPLCDIINIKKTIYIGLGFLIISHAGLTFFPLILSDEPLAFFTKVTLIALAIGTAFVGAPLNTALRRFIVKEHRGTGFNIYYLLMNIASIIAAAGIVEGLRSLFDLQTAHICIVGTGLVCTIIALIISTFINEHNYAEPTERLDDVVPRRPLSLFTEVWREKPFQRLLFFLIITLGVRLVFTHQLLVMPKYYTRVLTEDFELGLASAINPTIIVLGLIAIIPIINKYSTVKLMILGMTISSCSLFVLCIPPQWIMSLPFIDTIASAYTVAIVFQIAVFAVGELIFMPRFQEYIASIAPKDKVASYMALASLPMFIAKPINGFISGVLITYFCFDGIRAKIDSALLSYDDSPEFMWLIYTVLAVISPIAVILFQRHFLEYSSNTALQTSSSEEPDSEPVS